MASIITATTTSGLTQSADNSGVLQLASGTGNLVTVPSVTGTAMVSGNMPTFRAYNNATQNFSTNTWTKVAYQVEEWDTANCFDNTTNYRFTPNVAGYYQVNAAAFQDWGSAGGAIRLSIYKNGTSYSYLGASFGSNVGPYDTQGTSDIIYLNGSTDYIEVYVFTTNGSASIALFTGGTRFSACLIRSA